MPFPFSEKEIESEIFADSEEQIGFVPDLNLEKNNFIEWNQSDETTTKQNITSE